MITGIHVKNVKGIQDWKFTFCKPEMNPNKVHVLIAPNGFGKSSITRAFECLNQQRIYLKEKDCYQYDEALRAELSLFCKIDGSERTLIANQNINEIGKEFDTWVIRAPSKVKASQRPTGSGFQVPVGEFVIEDIEIKKVPDKEEIPYKYRDEIREYGSLAKAMPNLSDKLKDHLFLSSLCASSLGQKRLGKRVTQEMSDILDELKLLQGTETEIEAEINTNYIKKLSAIGGLQEIANLFDDSNSEADKYLGALQILKIHQTDLKRTKKALAWLKSENDFRRVKQTIAACNPNPGWLEPTVSRSKGKIVLRLPKPDKMSNGQRDFLCFISQLLKFEIHSKKKRRILIIDEVFDYLDHSNIVACQYYLKKFIDYEKSKGNEIYPWIFTHLDPSVFNSFIFSRKIQRNHFLDKVTSIDNNKGICKIIRVRDTDSALKSVFDEYHAHHSLSECDEKQLFQDKGLKTNWGCSHTFKNYCASEAQKYTGSHEGEVDYLATCLHVRIAIERMACEQLNQSQQGVFVTTLRTVSKLDKAQEFGAKVPELHYLLAGLMNTALHDTNPHVDFVSPVVSKLRNENVRAMIKEVVSQ